MGRQEVTTVGAEVGGWLWLWAGTAVNNTNANGWLYLATPEVIIPMACLRHLSSNAVAGHLKAYKKSNEQPPLPSYLAGNTTPSSTDPY